MKLAFPLTTLVGLWACAFPFAVGAHTSAGALLPSPGLERAQAPATVWDGVYAIPQARRGAALAERCRACHGFDLEGGIAPSLMGREFVARWNGRTLSDLFERIEVNFAAPERRAADGASAAIVRQQSVDFLAYLLIANGFPAGPSELADGPDTLKALRFLAARP